MASSPLQPVDFARSARLRALAEIQNCLRAASSSQLKHAVSSSVPTNTLQLASVWTKPQPIACKINFSGWHYPALLCLWVRFGWLRSHAWLLYLHERSAQLSQERKQPPLHRVLVRAAVACSFCCIVRRPSIGSAETAALRQGTLLVPTALLVNSCCSAGRALTRVLAFALRQQS